MNQDKAFYRNFPLYQLVIVLTLLLAAGFRFYKLDLQSFWNDEGNTARLVERTIPLIIEGAAGDVHPPGYYLLLYGWRALMGKSEFALRAYSVYCGVMTVALTAAIARHVTRGQKHKSWAMSLPALWFITLHPLAIYYSQEARMYAQLGLTAVSMLWAAILFQKSMSQQPMPRTRHQRLTRFFLLAGSVAVGLYTHYAFIFAVMSLSCAYGVFWLSHDNRNWRSLAAWAGAFAMGGLAFLPWAPIAIRASGWRPPDLGTTHALRAMARTLVVGVTSPDHESAYILPALALIGALILWKLPRACFAVWAAFVMTFLPMVMFVGFGFYRPAYLKFLMISISPLALSLTSLLTAWIPVCQNWRRAAGFLIGLLLIFTPAQMKALQHLYDDPAFARDNYRAIAAFIEMEAQPGDAVLLDAPNQWEVFTYYYRKDLPVYTVPYRPDAAEAAAWVADIARNHAQLFVLYWGDTEADPGRVIESALAQQTYKANELWVSSVRLARYGTGPITTEPTTLTDITLDQTIGLIAYTLPEHTMLSGDILPVSFIWAVDKTPLERYKVFVHLVDDTGTLRAQTDSEPSGGLSLTDQWATGEAIRDNYGVLLPEDLAPGRYTLLAGMYDFSGQRLPVTREGHMAGDSIILGTVMVESRQ